MNASCANGRRAAALEQQARDAAALVDNEKANTLYRQAARLEYYCSKTTNDPYAHDWYGYYYATDVWQSNAGREADEIARSRQTTLQRSRSTTTFARWRCDCATQSRRTSESHVR